jgi:hypothetical protein
MRTGACCSLGATLKLALQVCVSDPLVFST